VLNAHRRSARYLIRVMFCPPHMPIAQPSTRIVEAHNGAIIRKLSSREHYLIRALRIEFFQPSLAGPGTATRAPTPMRAPWA
jgi:hypothetical protein